MLLYTCLLYECGLLIIILHKLANYIFFLLHLLNSLLFIPKLHILNVDCCANNKKTLIEVEITSLDKLKTVETEKY